VYFKDINVFEFFLMHLDAFILYFIVFEAYLNVCVIYSNVFEMYL
jgi:hypothetical protein